MKTLTRLIILIALCAGISGAQGICPAGTPNAGLAKCYFIAANGSDSNSGTVEGGSGTVNTSGTSVTAVSGTPFNSAWTGTITINGTGYTIATINSATSATLTTSAGTQTGVAFSVVGSPWLHYPGMTNCTSNCAAHTPTSGEGFIVRGGDTYHFGNSGASPYVGISSGRNIQWPWSGSSANCQVNPAAGTVQKTSCLYVGVDTNWFTGSSWSRPKMFDDNTPTTVQPSSCAHANDGTLMIYLTSASGYTILDNFEWYGVCWTTIAAGSMVDVGSSGNEIVHNFFHGQMMGSALNCATLYNCIGTDPDGDEFVMTAWGGSSANGYNRIDHNVYDNSDGTCGSGACESDPNTASVGKAIGVGQEIDHNVFWEVSNVYIGGCAPMFHDNLLYYIAESLSGTHGNFEEHQTGCTTQDNFAFNNLTYVGPIGQGWDMYAFSSGSNHSYYFNQINFLYRPKFTSGVASDNSNGSDCVLLEGPSAGVATWQYFNNTTVASCNASGKTVTPHVNFTNNLFVGYGSPGTISSFSSATNNEIAGDLFLSTSTATADGYTASNFYAPTSGSSPTVGNGSNLTSTCTGMSNSVAAAACQAGFAGVTYNQTNHTVVDGTGVARPTSGAWDTGAYQYSAGSSPVATPTITPNGGTFLSTVNVTLADSTSGATICFTTDGSTPTANGAGVCTHGSTYSASIAVPVSMTVKAIASETGYTDSAAASAVFTINPVLPNPGAAGAFMGQ
jgi:Chitobiase/beta-hexosaminidase C-terminal domain